MEKKQGFFSALKEEVVRGLSPSRSRTSSLRRARSPMAILLRRKKSNPSSYGGAYVSQPEYGGLRLVGEALAPLMEGPEPDGRETGDSKRLGSVLGQWETSTVQYILQQYTTASGGLKLQNSIRNAYAMGKLKMVASEYETATKTVKNPYGSRGVESGGFVL
ncbi:hypothetical protein V6N13_033920 [Hibiscus sabdariffa]|uniref:Uncharacterized protein n=1 Tax=Hibiscus sabdariffa TaxID=183260 RepID=A0ABR2F962_9ROSI